MIHLKTMLRVLCHASLFSVIGLSLAAIAPASGKEIDKDAQVIDASAFVMKAPGKFEPKSGTYETRFCLDYSFDESLRPQTSANILLCDYATDAAEFKSALGDDSKLKVRRNINPALLGVTDIGELSKKLISELSIFSNPIAGTGILHFDFTPDKLLDFKRSLIC